MVLPGQIALAARNGDTAVIEEWFSTGLRDPDERDSDGASLLTHAMLRDRCETMRVILAHGADVNAKEGTALAALHIAATHGCCRAALLLLDHGAQVDIQDGFAGWTPLLYAAANGFCEMIRLLLRRGADFNACEHVNQAAEPLARIKGKQTAASLLADVRIAGGTWDDYLRFQRKRVLALRVLCEQGRASTDDDLLRRLFPAAAAAAAGVKRTRESYRAAKGGRLPRGVFWHILEYWPNERDSPSEE